MRKVKGPLVGMVKRQVEDKGWQWVEVSSDMLIELLDEAHGRESLIERMSVTGFGMPPVFRITDRRYGALCLKLNQELEGKVFVVRKKPGK